VSSRAAFFLSPFALLRFRQHVDPIALLTAIMRLESSTYVDQQLFLAALALCSKAREPVG
jgi:hypothetical protein